MRIDFEDRIHRTGRLIGWNLGRGTLYATEGDARHPEWRTPERVAAVKALAAIRAKNGDAPIMRFSGLQIDGALGNDGYHFEEPAKNVAPRQYFALMDEARAEPLITLNFGSGTAEEAARYAAHVAPRTKWFEIGNEVYAPWNTGFLDDGAFSYAANNRDPAWAGKPSSNPAWYAARALEYVQAVRRRVPDARFSVPLAMASMDTWGGTKNALRELKPLLDHPAVEAVVIHHYQIDDGVMLGEADKNSARFIVSGTERFRPLYEELAPRAIDITEYHVAGAFSRGGFARGEQAIMGLGIADLLIFFAQLGARSALQHLSLFFGDANDPARDLLIEPWYIPTRPDGTPKPGAAATRFIAEHLERHVVRVDNDDPLLHACAFVSDDGREGTLLVLNRDLEREGSLQLRIPPGWEIRSARVLAPRAIEDAELHEVPGFALPKHSLLGVTFTFSGEIPESDTSPPRG